MYQFVHTYEHVHTYHIHPYRYTSRTCRAAYSHAMNSLYEYFYVSAYRAKIWRRPGPRRPSCFKTQRRRYGRALSTRSIPYTDF